MAALTTVLGMIPLVFDAFFYSMAVTMIFGLSFATVLNLVVLPVAYSVAYDIRASHWRRLSAVIGDKEIRIEIHKPN